jgi:carbamoyltransferase
MDIAASIQKVTEEIMLRCARHAHELTGMKHLCLAGGVALNCVGNGRLLREGPFEDIWIQPAAGEAGGALGVAQFIWHQLLGQPREPQPRDGQRGSLLGPAFDEGRIRAFLERKGVVYHRYESEDELCDAVAGHMEGGRVVGWFQGRMEFGPRALGCRSIVGDARSTEMQTVMNVKIKFRESFRPFAPSVLEERVDEYFEMRPREQSPYMLLVADVHPSKRSENGDASSLRGLDKLRAIRSEVPAITHVDHSARVQTVDEHRHGRYYKLLKAFERRTGCPVVINTSFNVRGEPIVCAPEHAYRCFMGTNMDVLVLERFVLLKHEQPGGEMVRNEEYLAQFTLD